MKILKNILLLPIICLTLLAAEVATALTYIEIIRQQAESGDVSAQFQLGVIYDNGKGVKEDNSEAARWYRKAAEQGHAAAQYNLGVIYYDGEGVENIREGMRWFFKAAKRGHAAAQFQLGISYDFGWDVQQDQREAIRWYRKAAEQGHAQAQFQLGAHYLIGEGVVPNGRLAYTWLIIAKASGYSDEFEDLLKTKDWGSLLSPEGVESARQDAERIFNEIESRRTKEK